MICLKCGINQISIVHLFYGFLPPKVSVGFLLSVSIVNFHGSMILPYCIKAKRCKTALIIKLLDLHIMHLPINAPSVTLSLK